MLLLCLPLSYPKHINETLNSRESVALGGCFFSPLVGLGKSIEYSIISDHTIEAVYQAVTENGPERRTKSIVKKGEELKWTDSSDWLKKEEFDVLKGHDIVITCDSEENSGSQKVLCVLQYNGEGGPTYDEPLKITIGLDVNGMLQVDSKESLSDSVEQKELYSINYWLNQDPMLFTLNESVDDATRRYQESAEDSNGNMAKRSEGSNASPSELSLMYRAIYNEKVNQDKEEIDRSKGSVVNQIDKLFFKNRDSPFMSDVKKQLTQIRGSLTNRQPTMEAVEKGKKDLLELMYKLDEGSEGVERTKV